MTVHANDAQADLAPGHRRRWGWYAWPVLILAVLAGGWWYARRLGTVEVVAPGVMVVTMNSSDFADGYYRLLLARDWQIVRESSRGTVRDATELRIGRSARTFRMDDGIEVTVDTTIDGDRHIVFLNFRVTENVAAPPAEEMKRRVHEVTEDMAEAWREEARSGRWQRLKKWVP